MIEQVEHLISTGHLDEALEVISSFNRHQELTGLILTSRILEHRGAYQAAHDRAAEALALSLDQGRQLEELGARVALSYALLRLFRLDDCRLNLDHARSMLSQFQSHYQDVRRYEATIHNIEGLLHRYEGDLEQALSSYERSLEIRSKLGITYEIGSSKTNIGTIYQIMGELGRAQQYHVEAKEIFESLSNDHLLGYAFHSLGSLYWEMDNLKQAMEYLEQALSIRLQRANHHNTSMTLFSLIRLNLEYDYADHAQIYFNMLTELHQRVDVKGIDHYYDLARAMILQSSSRLVNRAEAQTIFEKYLSYPLPTDLSTLIYLNLCNLYLTDLKLSKDEELMGKVESLISDLHKIAKRQYSTLLRIETLLIQSKLFLVNLDLETAQQLLFQAELMANKKNLHHLAFRISAEHDALIDKLYKWEKLQKRNASLIERMEEVNFGDLIDSLRMKRHSTVIRRELEEPYFLLIMNRNALPLYTVQFDDRVEINQDLIGSFLLASDMGMAVALDDSGSIERIKYGEYTLIFIHHDRLVFCYGYEGQSYFAIRRLQDFIDRIRLGRTWELLRSEVPRPKIIEEDLAAKVKDYFSPDGLYSRQHRS